MKHPNRRRKLIIAFAILVTILSLITFIGSILFLDPLIPYLYKRTQISLFEILVVNLRHCVWVGLLLAPIVGWRYARSKLSGRLAVGILSVIAIVESPYLLVALIEGLSALDPYP
jgi:hypothetical protein